MQNVAEKILSPIFIQEELTDEIHKLLGRKYTIPILKGLAKANEGLGFRWIDVEIVGTDGSGSTARKTLTDLMEVGWVKQKGQRGMYHITDRGRKALSYANEGEKKVSIRNDGVGECQEVNKSN
jgi:DNA-binding HxlR family transcriptional regulator